MAEARRRFSQSDYNGVLAILEPYLASKKSRDHKSAAQLLLGRVYMELGHYNLASQNFYRVRTGEGGDAKVAAWYEAVSDLKRGRPHATIQECRDYIETYKKGRRVSECLVLIGDAKAAQGKLGSAHNAYQSYLSKPEHEKQMRTEEMALRIALATAEWEPEKAVPLLQNLALNHRFAATGAGAQLALDKLKANGIDTAVVPDDEQSQMRLATSMRRSGWANAAWDLFTDLKAQGKENPEIAAWVRDNESSFARTTRHPIPGTLQEVAKYNEDGGASGKRAWTIFEGWRKAGRWDKAAKWGRIGMETHRKQWPWRGQRDAVAQAIMLSGDWSSASEAWDAALKARNGPKNLALFYRSLTAHLAGEYERAEAGFTTLVTRGGRLEFPARYWRVRTREAAGIGNTMTDRTQIAANDPTGWYKLLLHPSVPEGKDWVVRDGLWHGPVLPQLPEFESIDAYPGVQVGIWPATNPILQSESGSRPGLSPPKIEADWSRLKWPLTSSERTETPPKPQAVPTLLAEVPDSYTPSAHYDREGAFEALRVLGNKAQPMWPDLKDAVHLAEAGLYDETGPILRAAYTDFKRINETGTDEEKESLKALNLNYGLWAQASRAGRDHHFSVRHLWGKSVSTEEDPEALKRLQFPVAYARELWPHCQRWNVDPFLILAIMRQESIYNPDALSPTGAIGLMQFIKGTGAKVSALLEEPLFSPHTLYNPSVNLRYSVYYFRLLNARFDGNFPIAIASYNGGPHHMSRAHRSTMGELDLDAFVEMIPRREPRDYVKKVVGFYQQYVRLYGPKGARVVLPKKLSFDDPGVVNF